MAPNNGPNRLDEIVKSSRAALGAMAAAIGSYAYDLVETRSMFAFVCLGAFGFLRGAEYVVPRWLEGSRGVRRRVFGRSFVEGWWCDVTTDPNCGNAVTGAAVSLWKYEGGGIQATGWTYDLDCQETGRFQLKSFGMPSDEMRYEFNWTQFRGVEGEGLGRLYFLPGERRPREYRGFFVDSLVGRRLEFDGVFIADTTTGDDLKAQERARIAGVQMRNRAKGSRLETGNGAAVRAVLDGAQNSQSAAT